MLAVLSNLPPGQRPDFPRSAMHAGQILGESRHIAASRAAKFFFAADNRRGKRVETARANRRRGNAKPLSIGNWIADRKIIAEIGVRTSPGSGDDDLSGSAVRAVQCQSIAVGSPVFTRSMADRLNRQAILQPLAVPLQLANNTFSQASPSFCRAVSFELHRDACERQGRERGKTGRKERQCATAVC